MSQWLTPGRRQAIQAASATIVTALTTIGLITGGQAQAITTLIAQILAAAIAALALTHLDRTQQATWLQANLRATVYALALAAAGVAMAFNLVGQDQVEEILTVISVVLTILQALVSIVNAPVEAAPTVEPASGGADPRAPGDAAA